MTYQFDTEVAKKHGLEEAVLIQNLQFWIQKNKAGKRHKHKDKTWTYNSISAWKELFDFWSESQIRRIINSLIDQGIIVKGNFNQNSYDRTAWYAFKDENYWIEDFNPNKRQEGYIYVLKNNKGNYKIGLSGNPDKRLKSINHEEVIGIFKTKDMFYNEQLLHDKFSKKNIKGEWFSLNKKDIQFIKKWDFDKIKTTCPNDKNHLCKSENGKELKVNSSISTDNKPYNNKESYCYGCPEMIEDDQKINHKSFIDAFNDLYSSSIRVTDKKRENIRARLRTFTGAEIKKAFENRLKDNWLCGEGSEYLSNWKAAMRNDEKIERYLLAEDNSNQDKYAVYRCLN